MDAEITEELFESSSEIELAAKEVRFEILRHEEDFVAIHKPPGFHVHQPEMKRRRVSKEIICLSNLRDQIQTYLYPVHRIDVGTEGVLVFALNKPSAANLCRQFQEGTVKKSYFAVVRGWTDDSGVIDIPLELDSTNIPVPSLSRYRTHQRVELPHAVGKRHATARYSLVEVHPETGRFHQVRRHMGRISHPLVGDCVHGDSHHNRFFKTQLGLPGLWLKAKSIEFKHPHREEYVRIESDWNDRWKKLFATLGFETPVSYQGAIT